MNGRHQPTSQSEPGSTARGLWTVGRLLTWTTDYLKRHGSESPRLDAEVMLAHVLDWQRVQLYTHFEEEVEPIFADRVSRAGSPPLRGSAGGLSRRPQGVLFAGLRGLAGRADSPSRIGIRGRRIPGANPPPRRRPVPSTWERARAVWRLLRRTASPRRRFVAIDVSEEALAVAQTKCRPASAFSTGSIFDWATSSSRSRAKARSTRSSPTPRTSPARRSSISSRESAITSPERPSTAARAGWTWSPG